MWAAGDPCQAGEGMLFCECNMEELVSGNGLIYHHVNVTIGNGKYNYALGM